MIYINILKMNIQLKVFPLSYHPSISNIDELEHSNKIILPPSILEYMVDHNIDTNVIFEIKKQNDYVQSLYMTAQEFSAVEGMCYIPYLHMQQAWLSDGEDIYIEIEINIPKGNSITLKPSCDSYIDIDNYKKKIEDIIVKRYSVLSTMDIIYLSHNNKIYTFDVMETLPADVIDMRNTDVDLHIMVRTENNSDNTKESTDNTKESTDNTIQPIKRKSKFKQSNNRYEAFSGKGHRLGN
jgi:hypothetical protein